MPRQITPRTTLENLKREAKRWLRALRENTGDSGRDARARLDRVFPTAAATPTLRDVQHALALEHGLVGWAALKSAVASTNTTTPPPLPSDALSRERRVAWFLENACPDHHVRSGLAHERARHAAMRILARYPDIAQDNIFTAIVCGDLAQVERILAVNPRAAVDQNAAFGPDRSGVGYEADQFKDLGTKHWEPLLFLCFTRLPLEASNDNAVAIARALLDAGADPNVFFMAGSSQYTPLVGVIGEGEETRPPHPRRNELVRLLLERGAEPYDIQVLYNVHFRGDIVWLMELIHEFSLKRGRTSDWDDPDWNMMGMGGYGPGAYYLLRTAIHNANIELAEWLLVHGANPNLPTTYSHPKFRPEKSLHEEALRLGIVEIAELLVKYGAVAADVTLSPVEVFLGVCLRLDRSAARAIVADNPTLLRAARPMLFAAQRDRVDVVELLLELGMSPNVAGEFNQRGLHAAAYANSLRVATLLIDRGAEVDAVATDYDNTPAGAAHWSNHEQMVALLGSRISDAGVLTHFGLVDRLREVLRTSPEKARNAPLIWLPTSDEDRTLEIATLLIANGANPSQASHDGQTPADRAERFGMFKVAQLLRAAADAGSSRSSPAPTGIVTVRPIALVATDTSGAERKVGASRVWDEVLEQIEAGGLAGLDARGQMTDDMLLGARGLGQITVLRLGGSGGVTDAGLRALERMPRLRHVDLSSCGITDRGLEALRALPELETISLAWTRTTDAGVMHLRDCARLRAVDLMGTGTGDGALFALAGKRDMRVLKTGNGVTDTGLAALRDYPAFSAWRGDAPAFALLSYDAAPTHLTLRGSFTDSGLAALVGLDGLFALNVDSRELAITPAGLAPLASLANLGWLAVDATDDSMPHIAAMPKLRFLACQDTTAGDDGFVALSRSRTIEHIWGRRCHNLRTRGFKALSAMPALRALSVSCLNVADEGIAALPDFPSLRELMPMDIPDEGYRHIAKCENLESLILMYCRDTGDRATEHIVGLKHLAKYFVSYNKITDHSLELLSTMDSLEDVELSAIAGVTDAGVAKLARLPRLRKLSVSGLQLSRPIPGIFPSRVDVSFDL